MQRYVGHRVILQLQTLGEQALSHRLIGLGLDAVDDVVHAGVAVTPDVVVAVTAGADAAGQGLQAVERVKCRHAPAEHVDAGLIALNEREISHQRQGAQLGLDACLGPHGCHGLANFFVIDVAVVGAGKVNLKTLRVTRLSQQPAGFGQVKRMAAVHCLGPARNLRRHQRARDLAHAAHRHFVNRFNIDRLVERLAHLHILERVFTLHVGAWQFITELVHTQKDGAVFNAVDDLQVRAGAQSGKVLRAGVQNEVNLTRQHGRGAGVLLLDRGVNNLCDIGLRTRCTPPGGVAHKHQFLVGLPLFDHERPAAHGVAVSKAFVFGSDVLGFLRLVFVCPGPAHDAKLGQLVEQNRIRAFHHDVNRAVIDFDNLVDTLGVDRVIGGLCHGAVQ